MSGQRRKVISAFSILVFLIFGFSTTAAAQKKRALLVGINTYVPAGKIAAPAFTQRQIHDLAGPVNDVEAMRQILVNRFGFDQVDVLLNEQAGREAILGAIAEKLVRPANKGDVSVFFYAGHGSQVKNSMTKEMDGLDESIVPADSWNGTADIRDKELRKAFNAVVDKGVILTAIFDSCNSGSIARGAGETRRAVAVDNRDVQDPKDVEYYGPEPETRGALIISAAQDSQSANEGEFGNSVRGAFSYALNYILLSASAPIESAQRIFDRTRARMQADGRAQEPVIAGDDLRRKQTLFGLGSSASSTKLVIPAGRVLPDSSIELQGGSSLGFDKDTELARIGSDQPVRVKVTEIIGLNRAIAKANAGNAQSVKPGDAFEIVNWVRPTSAVLQIAIPSIGLSAADLARLATAVSDEVKRNNRIQWIDDPAKTRPTHFVSWERGAWALFRPNGASRTVGAQLTAAGIISAIPDEDFKSVPKLFIHFPIPSDLVAGLKLGRGTPNDAVEVVAPERANYLLVGRVSQGVLEYSWLLRSVFAGSDAAKDAGTQSEILSPLPAGTTWLSFDHSKDMTRNSSSMTDLALRLAQIRSWIQIEAPASDAYYPYRIALKQYGTGKIVTGGELKEGDSYGLALVADAVESGRSVLPRFVYVFGLDSTGKGQLLYPPRTSGGVENKYPKVEEMTNPPKEIALGSSRLFYITPPFGIDTFVMVSSDDPIPDTSIFEFDGVTRGETRGAQSELGKLLKRVGSATRGFDTPPEPKAWSIDRVTVRSIPARQ